MNRSRKTADLASHGNIFVDIDNDRVGIGTTQPTHKIDVSGNIKLHDHTGHQNHITYKSSGPAPHFHFPTGPLSNLARTPYIGFGDRGDSSGDFKIYHDHYNAHLKLVGLGGLYLSNTSNSGVIGIQGSNGSGGVLNSITIPAGATAGVKLYQAGAERFETVGYGVTVHGTTETQELNVTGISTFSDDVFFFGTNPSNTSNKILFDKSNNQMRFFDSTKADFGQSGDLRIFHESAVSYIDCTNTSPLRIQSDDLRIRKQDGSEEMITAVANGTVRLYYDGSQKLTTADYGINVTGTTDTDGLVVSGIATVGIATISGNVTLGQTQFKLVDTGGYLHIQTNTGEDTAKFQKDGGSFLYFNNQLRLETKLNGIDVTGRVTASNGFYGDGSNITAVTATRVTTTDQSSDTTCFPLFVQATTGDLTPHTGTNLAFNSANGTLTATTFAGNLDLGSSNISSGTHTFTASAGSAVAADTTAVGSCNAIEYTIFISNSSNIQSQKVLIMDNGSTAYSQEFAMMSNPNMIATFSADVNGGNVRLLATPETGISGSTTIKFTKMIIE